MNPNSVKEQMGKSSGGKEEIDDDSEISARESIEGKEDDCMETASTWLALLSTFRIVRDCRYSASPR